MNYSPESCGIQPTYPTRATSACAGRNRESTGQSGMKCKAGWGKCIAMEALSFDAIFNILARTPGVKSLESVMPSLMEMSDHGGWGKKGWKGSENRQARVDIPHKAREPNSWKVFLQEGLEEFCICQSKKNMPVRGQVSWRSSVGALLWRSRLLQDIQSSWYRTGLPSNNGTDRGSTYCSMQSVCSYHNVIIIRGSKVGVTASGIWPKESYGNDKKKFAFEGKNRQPTKYYCSISTTEINQGWLIRKLRARLTEEAANLPGLPPKGSPVIPLGNWTLGKGKCPNILKMLDMDCCWHWYLGTRNMIERSIRGVNIRAR